MNIERSFIFSCRNCLFESWAFSLIVQLNELFGSFNWRWKTLDDRLNQRCAVLKISMEDYFHHGFDVLLVLFGGQENLQVFSKEKFKSVSVFTHSVTENLVNWFQNKLNKSSLVKFWCWASCKFLRFMVEVIVTPKKLRKGSNINTSKLLLVLKSHSEIGKYEPILSWSKYNVIQAGWKLIGGLVKSELSAIFYEQCIEFFESML